MKCCLRTLSIMTALLLVTLPGVGKKRLRDVGPSSGLLSGPGPTFVVPAKEIPSHWTVIAYGDTRFTDPANITDTNPAARRALVAKIAGERPDAVLISGDLPFRGAVVSDYAVYHAETAAWRAAKLRIYPALGNHELSGDATVGLQNWWAEFPVLKNRRWYSVKFGNAYFITLDSDLPFEAGSEQVLWLDGQLSNLPQQTQFVFLSLHHPLMGDDGPEAVHNVRPNEKLLKAYLEAKVAQGAAAGTKNKNTGKLQAKVIVIAGHTHNYARFASGGVIYLISGGGGAKPYPVQRTPDDLYRGTEFPNYHYVKFVYDGKQLTATMYRLADPAAATPQWDAKDSFTVTAGTVTAGTVTAGTVAPGTVAAGK